jgi:hypothetical protein
MSTSVCARKTPASPMAKSCKTKRGIPVLMRNPGAQIMFAQENI